MPKEIFCSIRGEWVTDQPEERVRQALIAKMVRELGYPKENIAVERALDQIPHLSHQKSILPDRRADIICFAKGIHPDYELFPLLLVECKAVKLTLEVVQQVLGYNYYLQAHYVVIANAFDLRTAKRGSDHFVKGLPRYADIVTSVSL